MRSNSYRQQSATIIAFPVRNRPAAAQESQQSIDLDERRWQLEWERRNIQD
jgi:hypothetical protein